MTKSVFILLDIDGVLVRPGGYRHAFINTVNYFLAFFGQSHLSVDEKIAEKFEFAGIQAEWDMVPLTIAAFFDWYAVFSQRTEPFGTVANAAQLIPVGTAEDFIAFLNPKILEYGEIPLNDEIYPLAVLNHCRQEKIKSILSKIWADPILSEILDNTQNVHASVLFRRLENEILGSKIFYETFGFWPEADLSSSLEQFDVPLISDFYREKIGDMNGGAIHACMMTARPNLLPTGVDPDTVVSHRILPEAEIARKAIGWSEENMPIVGVGSLCYVEEKKHLPKDAYLKPHPFHALTAILFALCKDQLRALETAETIIEMWERQDFSLNPLRELIDIHQPLRLAVFEDSIIGIKSCRSAGEILSALGYSVTAEFYGIATTAEKNGLMTALGVSLYPDVNSGLDVFFSSEATA